MPAAPPVIHLRGTVAADVPRLFEFQSDPGANGVAGTKPRDLAAFNGRWEEILRDPVAQGVTPRVIIAGGELVGSINISPHDGQPSLGYWIAREHWGKGIATRAIGLMLEEVRFRPLVAQVWDQNIASLRALERHGFVITSRYHSPESARSVSREMIGMRLG